MSDLARIADALERIADKIAPKPPEPFKRLECTSCDAFITGPPSRFKEWTEMHSAETGHHVFAREM